MIAKTRTSGQYIKSEAFMSHYMYKFIYTEKERKMWGVEGWELGIERVTGHTFVNFVPLE